MLKTVAGINRELALNNLFVRF